MGRHRLTLLFVCAILFFSCRKDMATSEVIVTPPQQWQAVSYSESNVLRAPGNYQEWKIASAPKLVSVNGDGEYEGFINFPLENTEFWLVKGTAWSNVVTYNQTGDNTFGFNGTFFKIPSGAGVYKMNASTNSFKWSCEKITTMSVYGTAAAGVDEEMTFNPSNMTWTITRNFAAGEFVFRANKANHIRFGHNAESETGLLSVNGESMRLDKSGSYTIVLSLQSAGNYVYSVKRNF
ncbi:hypothetical protein GWC95_16350 [Sediminibacterium roseum]|uniref:DUF5116 domain-containing protein n=1 Tax=Sediminibacterium roseum TaxID=1978412 RepID=A0ABW9ZYV8_9BACT|nr:hypothetical protein [Sediminibacterium roseum]NCI51502.1 hypothetical protein [Sediminibacterium roseum]